MKWMPFFLILYSPLSLSSIQEAWMNDSDPGIMSAYFTKNINRLPLRGEVTPTDKLWSGDYWALSKGNINYRWYSKNKNSTFQRSPSKAEAKKMSIPELAELSPAEKYDLFTGRYDYPLRNDVQSISNPKAKIWEGICHGWSPATLNHNEPTPKLLMNPDGIEVPFCSTDIKALLSYYYAYVHKAPDTHQMGKRCYKSAFRNEDRDCHNDLNAGAFHLVLTNRIGLDGKSFIIDLQRFEEVWNHPIESYDAVLLKKSPDGKIMTFATTISYIDENGHDWRPVKGTKKQHSKTVRYDYTVEINDKGEIIGGTWISSARPDFLWIMARPRKFEGRLSRLEELLNDD